MISILLPIVIIVVVVFLVRARRPEGAPAGGVSSLRRFLQYTFLLGLLTAGGIGLAQLITVAIPQEFIAARRAEQLALALALSVVAVPLWALLGRDVVHRLVSDPAERRSAGWGLYLLAALTGSLIVAMVNLIRLGDMVLGGPSFLPGALAFAVVGAGVWGGHVWVARHHSLAATSALRPLAVLAGSTVGLVAGAIGLSGVIRVGLAGVYDLVIGGTVATASLTDLLRTASVTVLVAGAVWWWHWLREAAGGPRDALWHGYVLLVAVLGGLIAAVTAAGVSLGIALQWLIGEPAASSAATHFARLPPALASVLVGVGVWRYHRHVLASGGAAGRTVPDRVYDHLAAFVGLVATAVGATMAIAAAIQLATPSRSLLAEPSGRNTLAVAITLLLVGSPLWVVFWQRIRGFVEVDPEVERRSPVRRAYLFVVFGATGVTAIVSFVVVLFVVFRDLLEGVLGGTTVHELRIAIGLVLAAGAVSLYHLAVFREDRSVIRDEEEVHPRHVLLVGPDGRAFTHMIAEETGARVRSLHRLDLPDVEIDPHDVAVAIRSVPHRSVLVTIGPDGSVETIPYEPV